MSPAQQSLLAYALEHAKGTGDALFQPRGNVRRLLADACEDAKFERCSPNDLARIKRPGNGAEPAHQPDPSDSATVPGVVKLLEPHEVTRTATHRRSRGIPAFAAEPLFVLKSFACSRV